MTFDRVFWNQLPSDSLMAAFFRQALSGRHPSSYLHFETGEDAEIRQLLHQRSASVEAVAAAVGYSTVSSFYRAFTQYFGCTPAQYTKTNAPEK